MKELYTKKEECCGCSACVNICPKHAIHMKPDTKGYLYPTIIQELCVECGLCEKVCPLKEQKKEDIFEKRAYGVKNKNRVERTNSSSGSVFIEVAKYILDKDGVVYGVALTSNFYVKHERAETLENARKFQGSKYVQSDKNEIFRLVQEDLRVGKEVLFTGTPCEVAGLKNFLRKDYENLYTLDIICHGVTSIKLLKSCLNEQEKKKASKIKELKFRDKKYGWRNQEIHIEYENGENYHAPIWEDNFYRLFTSNYILRDSCYTCKFATMDREGDITIGDFWNIKNVNEKFEDKLGVSSIIINSKKGQQLFEALKDNFQIIECSLGDITQHNLHSPSPYPEKYDEFQKDCLEKGFDYCLKKYGSMRLSEKIRRKFSPLKQKLKRVLQK
ncbi:hypothetical protein HMPREF1215_01155 [Coprococcus sp. HPP0074]|nr:hypothetical protein HMPREF1215_01155 [Coprococcus sp. HPP0074]